MKFASEAHTQEVLRSSSGLSGVLVLATWQGRVLRVGVTDSSGVAVANLDALLPRRLVIGFNPDLLLRLRVVGQAAGVVDLAPYHRELEDRSWQGARQVNTADVYARFTEEFPLSRHTFSAMSMVAAHRKFQREQAAARAGGTVAPFQIAAARDEEEAWQQFRPKVAVKKQLLYPATEGVSGCSAPTNPCETGTPLKSTMVYSVIASTATHHGLAEGLVEPPYELRGVELWALKKLPITAVEQNRRQKRQDAAEERQRLAEGRKQAAEQQQERELARRATIRWGLPFLCKKRTAKVSALVSSNNNEVVLQVPEDAEVMDGTTLQALGGSAAVVDWCRTSLRREVRWADRASRTLISCRVTNWTRPLCPAPQIAQTNRVRRGHLGRVRLTQIEAEASVARASGCLGTSWCGWKPTCTRSLRLIDGCGGERSSTARSW
ncbi:MAG: hypothetical protein IPG96_08345 [Proteobacteria bacterium]|nr:hypothetical protein [Pseudomonadota bacterium]